MLNASENLFICIFVELITGYSEALNAKSRENCERIVAASGANASFFSGITENLYFY